MATYYVTSAGAGSQTGADVANAWTPQQGFDAAAAAVNGNQTAAGDVVVWCADATYAPTVKLETKAAVEVCYVAGNASGVVDGTRVTLSGASIATTTSAVLENNFAKIVMKGIIIDADDRMDHAYECLGSGFATQFFECDFLDSTGDLVEGGADQHFFVKCKFSGAGTDGIGNLGNQSDIHKCLFVDCSTRGADLATHTIQVSDSVFINCGTAGIRITERTVVDSCSFLACPIGVQGNASASGSTITSCVFRTCSTEGIESTSGKVFAINCLFDNCTSNVGTGVTELDTASGSATFGNETAGTYDLTPGTGSGALATAIPLPYLNNGVAAADIGAIQYTAASGGSGGDAPTAAEVATAVWDKVRTSHATSGTFGEALVATVASRSTFDHTANNVTVDDSTPIEADVVNWKGATAPAFGNLSDVEVDVTKVSGVAVSGIADFKADVSGIATPPTVGEIATQVRTELAPELARVDVATSTRSDFDNDADTVDIGAVGGTDVSGPGDIGAAAVAVYYATLKYTPDKANTNDIYTAIWFKNGIAQTTSQATAAQITVKSPSATLIAATNMSETTGGDAWNHTASSPATAGVPLIATMTATIDGSTRTWPAVVSRDSAAATSS